MTPAPPDAPPTGAVCGDGVESGDDLYDCAAGGRLSGASVGGDSEEADQCVEGAAPLARRVERVGGTSGGVMPRPGRRRAEGPAARVSAGRSWPVSSSCPSSSSRGPSCVTRATPRAPLTVGLQLREHPSADHLRVRVRHAAILCVCVFAMRRSSDIGMVTSIAMVTSIGMVASIGRVASRPGESVPSVAEGIRPPPSRGRPRPASVLTGRARRASGRRTVTARCVAGGGIGLLRHAGVDAGCAPHARRPPLLPAAPIVPHKSR